MEKKVYGYLSCHGNFVYLSLWARMNLVASTFNRLLYGGTQPAASHNPDFNIPN